MCALALSLTRVRHHAWPYCDRIWLDFLKENHPDYRYITINEQRIDALSINDNIDLHLTYIELVEPVIDIRPNTLPNTEHVQEDFKRLPI